MKPLIILLIFILFNMTLSHAQSSGLDYIYDWQKAQQNLRDQEQLDIQAQNAYYQRQLQLRNAYVQMQLEEAQKEKEKAEKEKEEAEKEKEEAQKEREKAQICITQILNFYKALKTYPTISDGWHNVYATDNDMLCEVRKVYVVKGKVNRYVRLDNSELIVLISGLISNAKTMISIEGSDKNTYLVDLYFLNN